MLDIKYIIANLEEAEKKTADRGAEFDFVASIELDSKRKSLQAENDQLKAERNKVSKEIGAIKKAGGDISEIQAKMRDAGDRISDHRCGTFRDRREDERHAADTPQPCP